MFVAAKFHIKFNQNFACMFITFLIRDLLPRFDWTIFEGDINFLSEIFHNKFVITTPPIFLIGFLKDFVC
jgi:hypothetical protein